MLPNRLLVLRQEMGVDVSHQTSTADRDAQDSQFGTPLRRGRVSSAADLLRIAVPAPSNWCPRLWLATSKSAGPRTPHQLGGRSCRINPATVRRSNLGTTSPAGRTLSVNGELRAMDVSVAIACGLFSLAASLTATPNGIAESRTARLSAAPAGGWGEHVDYDARSPHERAS